MYIYIWNGWYFYSYFSALEKTKKFRMKLKILRTIVKSGIRTVVVTVVVAMSTIRTGGHQHRHQRRLLHPGGAIAAGGIHERGSESHLPSHNRNRSLRDRVTTNRPGDSTLVGR